MLVVLFITFLVFNQDDQVKRALPKLYGPLLSKSKLESSTQV